VEEVKELKTMYSEGTITIPKPSEKVSTLPVVGNKLYEFWYSASTNIGNTLLKYKEQLVSYGKILAKGLLGSVSAGIQIVIAFIIAGILLVYPSVGNSIRKFFRRIAGERCDEFADTALKTVGSVVKGVIGVAGILAILHGLVFAFAGIPFAGLLALGVFVLATLQLPSLILTIPVMIYLFSEHSLTSAIIWTVVLVVVGLSDNILKPILLGKGAPVPMLVIFIGVIGGFIVSGFIGLFTGAIIMSIGYKLFIYWINESNQEPEPEI
jgi:predicted PurR-regulated permease PerM